MQPAVATAPVVLAVEQPELQESALMIEEPETHEGALLIYDEEAYSGTLSSDLPFSEESLVLAGSAEETPVPGGSSSDEMPEDMDQALSVMGDLDRELELAEDALLTTRKCLQTSLMNSAILEGLVIDANLQADSSKNALDLVVLQLQSVQKELVDKVLEGNLVQTKLEVALSDIVVLRRTLAKKEESLQLLSTLSATTSRVEHLAGRFLPVIQAPPASQHGPSASGPAAPVLEVTVTRGLVGKKSVRWADDAEMASQGEQGSPAATVEPEDLPEEAVLRIALPYGQLGQPGIAKAAPPQSKMTPPV